jgi:hypothetical protein
VDEIWFQKHAHPKGRGEPLLGEASCLTEENDRCIFPEDFTWDIEEAIRNVAMRSMQQAAALNQARVPAQG